LAENLIIDLSQKIRFKSGDFIQLKNTEFSITIGLNKGSKCAVPGFNCGSVRKTVSKQKDMSYEATNGNYKS
jgi:hypothetical protein